MNPRLRVLLIGRHFWPHGSVDSAGYLIQLASGLQRRGIHVEVLTPRYASAWTTEMDFREIKVHRPFAAPKSDWSMSRYLRSIGNWLNEHAAAFDVLLVDSAREEAIATVESAKSLSAQSSNSSGNGSGAVRAVVRVSGYGDQSDRLWWESSRSSRRCAGFTKRADKVIVGSAEDERALLSQGFASSMVSRIDDGFDQAVTRTPSNRVEARRALTAINGDFHAPANEPVVLCVTNMARDSGTQVLIESARHLIARYSDLHLWLIGDGPRRDSIFQSLRGDGIRASIAMPGSFGNMEDVYRAADLFIHIDDTGMQNFLPNAIAAELPIVAVDNPQTRVRLKSELKTTPINQSAHSDADTDSTNADFVHWFQLSSPKTFRKAVRSVLDDLDDSQQKAANLKRNLIRTRSFSDTIDDYALMLEQVRRQRSSHQGGSSFGAVS